MAYGLLYQPEGDVAANEFGERTEITLIAFYDDKSDWNIGGIG